MRPFRLSVLECGAIMSISACDSPREEATARQPRTAMLSCASTSIASLVFRRK
jgi:hypothetical protein